MFGISRDFITLQLIQEVLHEMRDPIGAATDVPLQALTHRVPANSRPEADGSIGAIDAQQVSCSIRQSISRWRAPSDGSPYREQFLAQPDRFFDR
jgi:hypothetical protein